MCKCADEANVVEENLTFIPLLDWKKFQFNFIIKEDKNHFGVFMTVTRRILILICDLHDNFSPVQQVCKIGIMAELELWQTGRVVCQIVLLVYLSEFRDIDSKSSTLFT